MGVLPSANIVVERDSSAATFSKKRKPQASPALAAPVKRVKPNPVSWPERCFDSQATSRHGLADLPDLHYNKSCKPPANSSMFHSYSSESTLVKNQGLDASRMKTVLPDHGVLQPKNDVVVGSASSEPHPQWINEDLSCWLDAILCLLVHSRHLRDKAARTGLDSIILRVVKSYQIAQILCKQSAKKINGEKHSSIDRIKQVMNPQRDQLWDVLRKKLHCERGTRDSASCGLMSLLRTEPTDVQQLTNVQYKLSGACDMCSYQQPEEEFDKRVLTFSELPEDFSMSKPRQTRPCRNCNKGSVNITYSITRYPAVLFSQFVCGLPGRCVTEQDFVGLGSEMYSVCGMIQYKHNPDHFVTWIRDLHSGLWMECDDLKDVFCNFNVRDPGFPLREVHLVMWEAQGVVTKGPATPVVEQPKSAQTVSTVQLSQVPSSEKTLNSVLSNSSEMPLPDHQDAQEPLKVGSTGPSSDVFQDKEHFSNTSRNTITLADQTISSADINLTQDDAVVNSGIESNCTVVKGTTLDQVVPKGCVPNALHVELNSSVTAQQITKSSNEPEVAAKSVMKKAKSTEDNLFVDHGPKAGKGVPLDRMQRMRQKFLREKPLNANNSLLSADGAELSDFTKLKNTKASTLSSERIRHTWAAGKLIPQGVETKTKNISAKSTPFGSRESANLKSALSKTPDKCTTVNPVLSDSISDRVLKYLPNDAKRKFSSLPFLNIDQSRPVEKTMLNQKKGAHFQGYTAKKHEDDSKTVITRKSPSPKKDFRKSKNVQFSDNFSNLTHMSAAAKAKIELSLAVSPPRLSGKSDLKSTDPRLSLRSKLKSFKNSSRGSKKPSPTDIKNEKVSIPGICPIKGISPIKKLLPLLDGTQENHSDQLSSNQKHELKTDVIYPMNGTFQNNGNVMSAIAHSTPTRFLELGDIQRMEASSSSLIGLPDHLGLARNTVDSDSSLLRTSPTHIGRYSSHLGHPISSHTPVIHTSPFHPPVAQPLTLSPVDLYQTLPTMHDFCNLGFESTFVSTPHVNSTSQATHPNGPVGWSATLSPHTHSQHITVNPTFPVFI